jgi:hypothetical protein
MTPTSTAARRAIRGNLVKRRWRFAEGGNAAVPGAGYVITTKSFRSEYMVV